MVKSILTLKKTDLIHILENKKTVQQLETAELKMVLMNIHIFNQLELFI